MVNLRDRFVQLLIIVFIAHNWEAKTDYNASGRSKNEIDLQVGDIVGIAGVFILIRIRLISIK